MRASSDKKTHRRSRRAVIGITLGGLALLTGLGAASAKPDALRKPHTPTRRRPKRRPRPRSKVVTRTFANSSPIVIRDDAPAIPSPALIRVAGLKRGKLLDINVILRGFEHQFPRDVDMLLVAPNGRGAVILSDIGGNNPVSGLTIVLDDQATSPLPPFEAIRSGSYRPWNEATPGDVDTFPSPASASANVSLATFTGINPNGTWKLFVVDDSSSDSGAILGGWALTIKARVRV